MQLTLPSLLAIALGGVLGTLARGGLMSLFSASSVRFPWGIWIINCLGCLALGWVLGAGQRLGWVHGELKNFATIGFLGAFTTFSTFAYDTLALGLEGEWRVAAIYVVCSLLGGIAAVGLGLFLGLKL